MYSLSPRETFLVLIQKIHSNVTVDYFVAFDVTGRSKPAFQLGISSGFTVHESENIGMMGFWEAGYEWASQISLGDYSYLSSN